MQERMTTKLRRLLKEKDYLMAPCAYDALTAKCIEASGFDLIGTTGYGMHGAMIGTPDTGLLGMNETVAALSKMQNAVDIPILADGEGGYGSALNVIRMIREYEKTGIGGVFIEDQTQPPNCPFIMKPQLISKEEMVGKIKAAVDARRDDDLVIGNKLPELLHLRRPGCRGDIREHFYCVLVFHGHLPGFVAVIGHIHSFPVIQKIPKCRFVPIHTSHFTTPA